MMDIIQCGWTKRTATVWLNLESLYTNNDKYNCTNMPFHADNDNEGYWRIGGTLNH